MRNFTNVTDPNWTHSLATELLDVISSTDYNKEDVKCKGLIDYFAILSYLIRVRCF